MTGNPQIDLLLEAGPRAFDPDVPASVREEIAKSTSLDWYKQALKLMSMKQQALMFTEIRAIGRENREIERKAVDGLGLPYARIPLSVIEHFKALYGPDCWQDKAFMEDFLNHHPECRLIVKRGTRGQEYVRGT